MIKFVRNEEFERLYEEHAQRLFGFLVYRTGDRALAEDVLADTFESAFRARHRFDRRRASERTWLYSIALNRLRDLQRRSGAEERAMERSAPAYEPPLDDGLERVEHRDALSRAMDGLTPEEREAIALRFGADLTLKEMASVLGEPMTTAEGRVYRGLRKLRDALS